MTQDDELEIGNEWEAFLAGRWADHLWARGDAMPSWAWLNRVAHASEAELRTMSRARSEAPSHGCEGWGELQARVAGALLTQAAHGPLGVSALQQLILIPLELRLCQPGGGSAYPVPNGMLLKEILSFLHHPAIGR